MRFRCPPGFIGERCQTRDRALSGRITQGGEESEGDK